MSTWKIYEKEYPYFLTITVVEWLPLFISPQYLALIVNSLRFCQSEKGLCLHGYVIMPNHLHLIASSLKDLASIIGQFKSFTSHKITALLQAEDKDFYLWVARDQARKHGIEGNKIWQDGYHPEQLYSRDCFEQKLNYIHQNPVRGGLVSEAEHWLHSSARFYSGGESVLEIEPVEW